MYMHPTILSSTYPIILMILAKWKSFHQNNKFSVFFFKKGEEFSGFLTITYIGGKNKVIYKNSYIVKNSCKNTELINFNRNISNLNFQKLTATVIKTIYCFMRHLYYISVKKTPILISGIIWFFGVLYYWRRRHYGNI